MKIKEKSILEVPGEWLDTHTVEECKRLNRHALEGYEPVRGGKDVYYYRNTSTVRKILGVK